MYDIIVHKKKYSTTQRVIKTDSQDITDLLKAYNKINDKFETQLFIPETKNRKGQGGLRSMGYFKVGRNICNEKSSRKRIGTLQAIPEIDTNFISKSDSDNIISKPLITIITVVFNGENYIEETILSVINQTYDNVEYIIIDGGSTDGTLDIIKKYEQAIDYWVSEKDSGIYDAMNKGIQLATGDWINFMNAGDVFSTTAIATNFATKILNSKANLVYGTFNLVKDNGLFEIKTKNLSKINLSIWGTRVFCHQALFVSRSLICKYSTKYKLKGELDWYFNLMNSKPIINILDFPIVNYRLGGVGDVCYKLNMIESLKVNFNQNVFIGLLSLPLLTYKFTRRIFK